MHGGEREREEVKHDRGGRRGGAGKGGRSKERQRGLRKGGRD